MVGRTTVSYTHLDVYKRQNEDSSVDINLGKETKKPNENLI